MHLFVKWKHATSIAKHVNNACSTRISVYVLELWMNEHSILAMFKGKFFILF